MSKSIQLVLMIIASCLVGGGSRWTYIEWQFWTFTVPVCAYIGVIANIAARSR